MNTKILDSMLTGLNFTVKKSQYILYERGTKKIFIHIYDKTMLGTPCYKARVRSSSGPSCLINEHNCPHNFCYLLSSRDLRLSACRENKRGVARIPHNEVYRGNSYVEA